MCIVIDTNTLPLVFQGDPKFVPVWQWIVNGRGVIVYGGTKYKNELKRMPRYAKILKLLMDKRKVCEIRQDLVDNCEQAIISMTKGTNCNDQHIIAIFSVSKCMLFCSLDRRSYEYVQDKRFYPKGQKPPRIYRSSGNQSLLDERYIIKLHQLV